MIRFTFVLIQQLLLFQFGCRLFLIIRYSLNRQILYWKNGKWDFCGNTFYEQYKQREIGHISIKFILVLTYSNPGGRYFVTWVKQSNKNMFHGKKTWRLHNHMVALITERAAVNRLSHQTLAANAQKYSKRCHGIAVIKRNIIPKNYYFR